MSGTEGWMTGGCIYRAGPGQLNSFVTGDSTKSPSQSKARRSLGRRPEVSQPALATISTFVFTPN